MLVDGGTRIFGVVGDPVKQVKTPVRINAEFKRRGENLFSIPFHVEAKNFQPFWQGMKSCQNVIGFGVTVPHKVKAMQLCDTLGPNAKRIGVVNVVRRQPNGDFHGDIFDGHSFVKGLVANGCDPAGQRVYMYGAGGAATAISFALIDARVESISIQNRTKRNADILVKHLQDAGTFKNADRVDHIGEDTTLVINASSLGMNDFDEVPIDPTMLSPHQFVAEVVASPEKTKLLIEAENRGCTVHSGIHMITNQIELLTDFVLGK